MLTVFELLKFLPKDNCGDCGEPTCMAFATKVVTANMDIKRCPHLDGLPEGLMPDKKGEGDDDKTWHDPETQLLKELKNKIKSIDLKAISDDIGAEVIYKGDDVAITFPFIDDKIILSHREITSVNANELDPRDQILIYNYCFFGGKGPVANEWVGLEAFPNSISKVVTLKRYTEDKLAEMFRDDIDGLKRAVTKINGEIISPCVADLCFKIRVLPKIILLFHFWREDKDEGFDAKVKVLYDRRAIEFLDIESLVFAAERVVEKLG